MNLLEEKKESLAILGFVHCVVVIRSYENYNRGVTKLI